MRTFLYWLAGLSTVALAGTGNLPQINTRVIQLAHVNDIRSALTSDFVPRNTPSGVPTDLGGNLGTGTYRWASTNAQTYNVIPYAGANAVTIAAPSPLPSPYILKVPSAPPASNGATLLMDTSGNVTASNSVFQPQISSSSGSFSTTSATYVAVTNLAVTITTGANGAGIQNTNSSGTQALGEIELLGGAGGSTLIGEIETGLQTPTGNIASDLPCTVQWIDSPAAGTYTYTVEAKSLAGTVWVLRCELVAYEL